MRKLILLMTLCGLLAAYAPADIKPPENGAQEPAEIVSLRTERSETFDNHDGTFVTKVYSIRKYYYKDGIYRNIDLSTEVEAKDGFTNVVSAGPYSYRFDPHDKSRGYRFERNNYYVKYCPAGDWTGKTSIITPTTEGVKEEIILTSESDAAAAWKVETNALVSFTNGVLTFSDSAGTFLFHVPHPWAQDAEGNEVNVTAGFSGDILIYTLELTGTVIWPVTVDPSTTINPSVDGYVYAQNANRSIARDAASGDGSGTIRLSISQAHPVGQSYIIARVCAQFSITIPVNSTVDSTKLYLEGQSNSSVNTDFNIYTIEGTQTGSVSTDDYSQFTGRNTGSAHTPTYYGETWNTSSYSAGWNIIKFVAAGNTAVENAIGGTLKIFMIPETDLNNTEPPNELNQIDFDSSETSGKEPYIEIWYTEPPVTPPTNFSMTALDSITIACSWNDQSDNEDKFYIMNLADSTVVDSTAANAVADTISELNWNTKYVWMAVADSSGVRGYSDPDSTYTLLPAPEACDITIFPISSDTLRIKLTEPVNPTTGDTGMEVYAVSGYGATGSGWFTGNYSYLDGGLNPDSTYVYKTRYRNAEGYSTAWSPDITYSMNGLDTLVVYLGNDSYDDYNVDFGNGRTDSTVVRAGASNSGELLDGFLSFDLPWRVVKGGVDSLFLSMTRTDEQSAGMPALKLYGIPEEDIDPVEELNLGAQDSTGVTVNWTISSGEGEKTSPDMRVIFRAWQDLAVRYGFQHGFGLRLDDNAQADSVRAVFLDVSNSSYSNGTKLTIYYTPGEPDLLDGKPDDFAMTVLGPDSLRAEWTDNSTTEYGYLLCNLVDSLAVAGVDSLDKNTTSVDVGSLTPNTVYEWYVKAYTVYDDSTSSSDSERTLARIPGIPTVYALSDTTLRFIIDPQDNPSWTAFAVQDSITGKYVDGTAEPDTLRPGSLGEWGWRTYSQWGSAAGDTLTGLKPDSLYVIRVKARSEE